MSAIATGYAVVADGPDLIPCKLFDVDNHLWAYDPSSNVISPLEDSDIVSVFDVSPARVFPCLDVDSSALQTRMALAANKTKWEGPGKLKKIPPLPEGFISGYPVARRLMDRHRAMKPPTLRSVFACFLFARTTIRQLTPSAEKQFARRGEKLTQMLLQGPGVYTFDQFQQAWIEAGGGMQDSRTKTTVDLLNYAPIVVDLITRGLMDRALRRELVTKHGSPEGIGLAKVSFSLALLGHDTICFDGQLLKNIFRGDEDRISAFTSATDRSSKKADNKRFTDEAVDVYEQLEDAFTSSNPDFYDPKDALGRARTQWTTWEAVSSGPSSHLPWIKVASTGQWKLPKGYKAAKAAVIAQRGPGAFKLLALGLGLGQNDTLQRGVSQLLCDHVKFFRRSSASDAVAGGVG